MATARSHRRGALSVSDSLSITIDGPKLQETPDRLETTGSFAVEVANHGRATHVHLALDGELAEATAITEPNQFIDSGEQLTVPVRIDPKTGPLEGALTVATGYGADDARISISIGNNNTPTPDPEPTAQSSGLLESLGVSIEEETLAFGTVAVFALLLAVLAVQLTQSTIVMFGAVLVIGVVATGVCYLIFT